MPTKKKNLIKLECVNCKKVNYYTRKSKGVEGKLNFNKFCPHCLKHTLHKEMK